MAAKAKAKAATPADQDEAEGTTTSVATGGKRGAGDSRQAAATALDKKIAASTEYINRKPDINTKTKKPDKSWKITLKQKHLIRVGKSKTKPEL